MSSNQYLRPRNDGLQDKKQKSCESYDSTCSNYSQASEQSDSISIPKPGYNDSNKNNVRFNTQQKSSLRPQHSDSYPSFSLKSPNQIKFPPEERSLKAKSTFWNKMSSFKMKKNRSSQIKRHKSVSAPSVEHDQCQHDNEEIDPVYHLLRCAASQAKLNVDEGRSISQNSVNCVTNMMARSMSIQDSQSGKLLKPVVCINPDCPCFTPEKIPVVKKEDLGQQAKREQYNKYRQSPRKSPPNSRNSMHFN